MVVFQILSLKQFYLRNSFFIVLNDIRLIDCKFQSGFQMFNSRQSLYKQEKSKNKPFTGKEFNYTTL